MKTATQHYVKTKDPFTQMELVILHTGKLNGEYAQFLVLSPRCNQTYVWRRREEIY